ncbi:MAG TPA: hypothetical protein VMY99_04650 [Nevskiaceae bacterium]|nr:hypothetical protein [Nevskiaceae bacterium]
MNKLTKISNRQLVYGALAMLVLGSYAATAALWQRQRTEISSLNSQLQIASENQFAMNGGSYNAVTIMPSEGAVYLPFANLKLPDTTLNMGLVYHYKPAGTIPGGKKVFPPEVSVSTHDLANNNFSTTQQFDCSQVAYADFGAPSYPVNPKYKSNSSVKLADGRLMNIYYAPSIPGCEATWKLNGIDAKAIADSLKQAVSY